MNSDVKGSAFGHHPSAVSMAGIGVAACIILIERLDNAVRILRIHLAQDLVDLGLDPVIAFLGLR